MMIIFTLDLYFNKKKSCHFRHFFFNLKRDKNQNQRKSHKNERLECNRKQSAVTSSYSKEKKILKKIDKILERCLVFQTVISVIKYQNTVCITIKPHNFSSLTGGIF